jgi:hypothetical protein
MTILAVAIVLAMILYIVDRNHVWPQVWKYTKRAVIVCIVLGVVGYAWIKWDEHKQRVEADKEAAEQQVQYKEQKAVEEKAKADRWAELNSIQQQVCGDKLITLLDVNDNFPQSGEISCSLPLKGQDVKSVPLTPLTPSACAILKTKLPTFSCLTPSPKVDERTPKATTTSSHLKAISHAELTTREYGSLKCGEVQEGEIVTLLEDSGVGGTSVKVRTASGVVGWAPAYAFEVIQ